jgi:hypothetical protein
MACAATTLPDPYCGAFADCSESLCLPKALFPTLQVVCFALGNTTIGLLEIQNLFIT